MCIRDRLTNLPVSETLVGRDADTAALTQLLAEHRLVTVLGAGGIGKTRLAQAVARRLVGAYAHGVWWVDLSALSSPEQLVPAIAAAAGVRPTADHIREPPFHWLRDITPGPPCLDLFTGNGAPGSNDVRAEVASITACGRADARSWRRTGEGRRWSTGSTMSPRSHVRSRASTNAGPPGRSRATSSRTGRAIWRRSRPAPTRPDHCSRRGPRR